MTQPISTLPRSAVGQAAASIALRPLLMSAPITGRVLGTSSGAVWIAAGSDCLVAETPGGIGLPNGLVTGAGLLRELEPGDPVEIGAEVLDLGRHVLRIGRWWNPRPALPPLRIVDVIARCPERTDWGPDAGLAAALAGRDGRALVGAALGLLGRGTGLTPAGDDLLAGAVSAFVLVGEAAGDRRCRTFVADAGEALVGAARARTTRLSAALLAHAVGGRVAGPVAAWLLALAGRGDVDRTREAVLSMGHSSGPALAAGIEIGIRAIPGSGR